MQLFYQYGKFDAIYFNIIIHSIIQAMFSQYQQDAEKGLFTFYREQAVIEQQIRKQKKQQKLQKIKERQQRQILKESQKNQQQSLTSKQFGQSKNGQQFKKTSQPKKPIYQPKIKKQKYEKQKIGQAVIVVGSSSRRQRNSLQRDHSTAKSKKTLKKIEDMINSQNYNRYFLQNKELPAQFGNNSIQRQIISSQIQSLSDLKSSKNKQTPIRMSYFNKSGQNLEEQENKHKKISNFSYEKLPEINQRRIERPQSFVSLSKRYKSKKVEQALRSGDSETIRKARQKIHEDPRRYRQMQKNAYIDFNNARIDNEQQRMYNAEQKLNEKQKKLIEIIYSNYLHKRK